MKWVKCSEKLPPINHKCLMYDINEHLGIGYIFEWDKVPDKFWIILTQDCSRSELDEVTHWADLPRSPK